MKRFAVYHVYSDGRRDKLCEVDADEGKIQRDELGRLTLTDENKEWVTFKAFYDAAIEKRCSGWLFAVGDKIVFEEVEKKE